MNLVCIIPARKNSKRLPGKNMRLFKGKPLIQWTIEQALRIFKPEQIYVNSDWQECLDLAKQFNVVAYKRPDVLSGDKITTQEVLDEMNLKEKMIVLLQCTSPVRSDEDIRRAIKYSYYNKVNIISSNNDKNEPNGQIYVYYPGATEFDYIAPMQFGIDIDTEFDFEVAEVLHVS